MGAEPKRCLERGLLNRGLAASSRFGGMGLPQVILILVGYEDSQAPALPASHPQIGTPYHALQSQRAALVRSAIAGN